MKTLVLFDVSNFIFRAYHSNPKDLTNANGEPTNAIYGVAFMFLAILKDFSKTRDVFPVCCFDGPHSRKTRTDVDETYKQNRLAIDDALKVQFKGVKTLVDAMNLPKIEIASKEADDVIASLVHQQKENFEEIIICSPDKDLCQCVINDNIKIYDPKKKVIITKTEIEEKYKVSMNHFKQYQALIGDKADNVKGVKGIGPKYATTIINECNGNIEEYVKTQTKYARIIQNEKENYTNSLKMVTLETDLKVDLEFIQYFPDAVKDNTTLKEYFQKQGFQSLLKRYYQVEQFGFIDETI